jgi:hypothetical protein
MLAAIAAIAAVGACRSDAAAPGQLVVSFQSDMAMPDMIDTIHVQVASRGGALLLDTDYEIGGKQDQDRVPGTLTLVAGKDPSETVTVRVAGVKDTKWRTFRELTSTIPQDRIAQLRMPVQWLCFDQVQTVSVPDATGATVTRMLSTCDDGFTCKAGRCQPNTVDSTSLPTYSEPEVFGGANNPNDGSCYDTITCTEGGSIVTPDADCTIPNPHSDHLNIGLRVAENGICDNSSEDTLCFVPLDANSDEGWTVTTAGDRVQLTPGVCDALQSRKVIAVYVSTDCVPKNERNPPCGDWSSVPSNRSTITSTSTTVKMLPTPQLVTSLVTNDVSGQLCSPLIADGSSLYACTLDSGKATLHSLQLSAAQVQNTSLLTVPTLASTVYNGTLYWLDSHNYLVNMQSATDTSALPTPQTLPGSPYDKQTLLADSTGLYMLATGVTNTQDTTPVQLFTTGLDGKLKDMEPIGIVPVLQLAQNDSALFVIVDVGDTPTDNGQPFTRTSSVLRIDKTDHTKRATVLGPNSITVTDKARGGFLGVQADNMYAYAVYETAAAADNTVHLQLFRIDASATTAVANPTPIYDLQVQAPFTQLRLIGSVAGVLVLARVELESNMLATRSSTLSVVPANDPTQRILAVYTGDFPTQGIAADDNNVFWLNDTGRLYKLDRSALR